MVCAHQFREGFLLPFLYSLLRPIIKKPFPLRRVHLNKARTRIREECA